MKNFLHSYARILAGLFVFAICSGAFVAGQTPTSAPLPPLAPSPTVTPKPHSENTAGKPTPLALDNNNLYKSSAGALTVLFVTAVLLESAFSIIFKWRVFLAYASARGLKTPIMIVASLLVVWAFGLDTVGNLIAQYRSAGSDTTAQLAEVAGPLSKFLTALILAGGSAGVHTLMANLGFRESTNTTEATLRPPSNRAWVALTIARQRAVGAVRVSVRDLGSVAGVQNAPPPIAGIVSFRRPSLSQFFFRQPNRFPANGGHVVTPDHVYEIVVTGVDSSGVAVTALQGEQFVFAAGAIVDLDVAV